MCDYLLVRISILNVFVLILKDCPFDDPVVLLRRNLAPGLEKDIKNHIEATAFYVKLGKCFLCS